ncbi:LysE family translocator [Paracoccaceae bacterium GXU_MW_L88]
MDMLLPYLAGFGAAYAILLVAVLSPGPAVALILGVSMSQGRQAALVCSLGVASGALLLAVATNLGLGALLTQVAWAAVAVKIAGASYLAWLSLKSWQKALTPPAVTPATVAHHSLPKNWLMGFLMQITNPKAIVFWLAISSVGAITGAPAPVAGLFFLGAFAMSLAGHGAYAILLSSSPMRAAYNRARRWIEAALGTFMAYMAVRMATERV